ncbi:hypothetical protein HMPREF3038_00634 [Akkermansia sp. KLE1797]|nr:hypothetical protein HMPREF3038_00634 [Akkermansia sp. KLE1797]KZA04636.1 hypothetical protein HMPREF1326_01691 [Akkermansia sp. KLE1605]
MIWERGTRCQRWGIVAYLEFSSNVFHGISVHEQTGFFRNAVTETLKTDER